MHEDGDVQVGDQPVERTVAPVVQQRAADVGVDPHSPETELRYGALQLLPASRLQRRHVGQGDDASGEPFDHFGHPVVEEARRGNVDPVQPATHVEHGLVDAHPIHFRHLRRHVRGHGGRTEELHPFPAYGEPVLLPDHGLARPDEGPGVPVVFLGHPVVVRVDDQCPRHGVASLQGSTPFLGAAAQMQANDSRPRTMAVQHALA